MIKVNYLCFYYLLKFIICLANSFHFHKLAQGDSFVAQEEGTAVNGLDISTVTLTGNFNNDPTQVWIGSATGIFSLVTSKNGYAQRNSSDQYNGKSYLHVDATHSHTLEGDNETRPKNYTVRIWKRVS